MSDSTTSSSNVSSSPQVSSTASVSPATAAASPSKGSSPASHLPSTTPVSSVANLRALDEKLYNDWMLLFAQAMITDGQRYGQRVIEAMKRLRDGEQ